MTRELKRVVLVVMAMFLSLFISSTTIQFIAADSLAQDQRNVRTIYESYKTQRGSILVDGKPIAYSEKYDDAYRFLRVYENRSYSAITGFFSVFQGATGIESSLNSYLSGQNSSQFFEQINALLSGNPVTGASVELTIDPDVQQAAWDAMGKLKGAAIAIEPSTGRILALVSRPGFDANLLAVHDSTTANTNYRKLLNSKNDPLINKAISGDLYHPGSIFKVLVAAAAFESGDFSPETEIPNPEKFRLPGTETFITNSGEGKCGGQDTVSIADALKLSCNVPFAQLAISLGEDKIRSQAELFGFGKEIDIPILATPSIYPLDLDDAQVGLTGFGQYDVRVTPLQMAMMSAAVANKGLLMKPNLVEYIVNSSLAVLSQPTPSIFAQPVSEATAERLKEMMVAAVSSGVSSNAQIDGVRVAGKTGTAQNGEDEPYTLWFTGFAPAEDARVAVAVVIEDGGGMGQSGFGNLLAAPVARKIMQAVLGK